MLLTRPSTPEASESPRLRTVPEWNTAESEAAREALAAGGIGALESPGGNLPLARLALRAQVTGLACQTFISQVYRNPHDEFVEATYIFPLPGRFAVTDCTMRVGGRVIKAELQERSQARANYDRAIKSGRRAAIAEEERSETFSFRVGNIPPREEVIVELTLAGTLAIAGGEATLRFPLVVAPRYVAGQPLDGPSVGSGTALDTDQAPDASRVTPPTLLPGFQSPVALSIEVELRPGEALAGPDWPLGIRSSLHSVFVVPAQGERSDTVKIRLQPGERLNRDFILRFPVLPVALAASLDYACPVGQQLGTFAVTVLPPALPPAGSLPRDVVFVLDRSGSMEGWKMTAARRAVARMIDTLGEADRFRVLAFDDHLELPPGGSEWRPATDRSRWEAAEWIAKIESRGGTELGSALRAALQPLAFGMPADREPLVVLITDGQVAGEDSLLRTLESLPLPRPPRVFALGIDRAVNAGLLARLAAWGGGACELVESEERLDQVLERVRQCLAPPVLTEVQIEPLDCDLVKGSFAPQAGLAAFADRPLTIFGRVAGSAASIRLRVTGRDATGQAWAQELTARRTQDASLLALWGRSRVRDLEDSYARGHNTSALQNEIVAVSLESHVLSRFTAFVAVDRAEVVNPGGLQHQIVQPVEKPEGWAMGAVKIAKRYLARMAGGDTRGRMREFAKSDDLLRRKDLAELQDAAPAAPAPAAADAYELVREEIRPAFDEQYDDIEGESADFCLQEFTDTAIDYCESETTAEPDEPLTPSSPPIVRLVELMIAEAYQLRATHIALRPGDEAVEIFYAIDGNLERRDSPPRRLLTQLILRLCDVAKITYQANRLQVGELPVTFNDRQITARLYVFPTADGPAAVIRMRSQTPTAAKAPYRRRTGESSVPWPVAVQTWLAAAQAACIGDAEAAEIYRQLAADCA